MKKQMYSWDERSQQVAGQSAMIALGLTQVALGIILFYRLYVLGQPGEEVRDLQGLLFGSIVIYFVFRSFIGGLMPVPTFKQGVLAYVGMVIFLFAVLSIWLGLPDLTEWTNNILPTILGPAIIVIGYWLISALGRRRIERTLSE